MPNNRRRITKAVRAVRRTPLFKRLETVLLDHRRDEVIDAQTALVDALADLRHIADKYRVDWDSVVTSADDHYDAETASELVGRRMRTKVADSNTVDEGEVRIPAGWLATIGQPYGEHYPVMWDDGPGGINLGWCLWTEEQIRRDADLLEVADGPK